jgi:hypothetical protein
MKSTSEIKSKIEDLENIITDNTFHIDPVIRKTMATRRNDAITKAQLLRWVLDLPHENIGGISC